MRRPFIEVKCYETYYFANMVRNILHDQFAYIRFLNDFYGDGKHLEFSVPFPRLSAFHSFIGFVLDDVLIDPVEDLNLKEKQETERRFSSLPDLLKPHPSKLPISEAFDYYEINHTPFSEWLAEKGSRFSEATEDDVCEYYSDLRLEGPFDSLLEKVMHEVFFILFQNRSLLMLFNEMMARQISDTSIEEIPSELGRYFASAGKLKRFSIPSWVQRAIYFRDRGLCVLCHRDLSGIVCIGNLENFDHIVPLALGGLNDVTNIQLLCKECNSQKLHHTCATSDFYEAWYPLEE